MTPEQIEEAGKTITRLMNRPSLSDAGHYEDAFAVREARKARNALVNEVRRLNSIIAAAREQVEKIVLIDDQETCSMAFRGLTARPLDRLAEILRSE